MAERTPLRPIIPAAVLQGTGLEKEGVQGGGKKRKKFSIMVFLEAEMFGAQARALFVDI